MFDTNPCYLLQTAPALSSCRLCQLSPFLIQSEQLAFIGLASYKATHFALELISLLFLSSLTVLQSYQQEGLK